MKKHLRLMLTLLTLTLGGTNASAQQTWTDKTSVITNPSFETDDAIANLKDCGWATDRVTGWTIAPNSPGNSQVGVGNSSSVIQGIASSFAPSAGEKYFYMRENWNPNTTFSVSQTIQSGNIPAGFYRLTVKAAMFSSVASTYTLSLQEAGQTAVTNSFSYAGTANSENWRDWSVVFYKQADDTDLTITAAYKTPGENSGSKHYCLLLDDVKLELLTDVSSDNPFDMTSWIVNPSFELNTFNGTLAEGSSIGNSGGNLNKPTGWTCFFNVEGWRDCSSNTTAPADGTYCMNSWFGTIREQKFYQTIDYLPEGIYEISAQVRTDQSETTGIYTFGVAGETTFKSDSWDASKMAETWNSMDNWQTLTARATIIGGGSLQFGLRSDKFVQFDDFHLTYLGTDLLLEEVNAAWQKAHDDLADLDATLLPDAAEAVITEELEKARPNTQAEIEAATAAMQALINSYPGIKAAYDEYKALKAKVSDLKNTSKYTFIGGDALTTFDSTLSDINTNAEAATEAATLTALLPNLKAAGNNFVGAIESNDGFDLTYNVENNSFETGALAPWTAYSANDTGVRSNSNSTYTTNGVDGDYLFNTWGGSAEKYVKQTLANLPEGYYTVTVSVASDANNKITIYAGSVSLDQEASADGKGQFIDGITPKTHVEGSLEIGAKSTDWYKADNFRLTYYTITSVASNVWAETLAEAQELITNAEYECVIGEEKTRLAEEIAKQEPTTADGYNAAVEALQNAISAFKEAKTSYEELIAAKELTQEELPYASEDKYTAIDSAKDVTPESAADAKTKANAIVSAIRTYVESNAMAEGVKGAVDYTDAVKAANADTNTGWTGGIGTNTGEGYIDAEGNKATKYLDGGWSQNAAVNVNMTREVVIPAGKYILTVTARGAVDLTEYKLTIADETIDLPHIGSGEPNGVFGWGWNDAYVVFDSDGTPQTLTITAKSEENQQWISLNRFRLVQIEKNLDVYATTEDYSVMNAAIAAAEEKTLGFEAGEYAPYNNVAALEALSAAKAIDQEAQETNLKVDVQNITSSLNSATWTDNAEEVNAVFNGMFDSTVEGDWGLTGWTRTNAWGQQRTSIEGEYGTAYYNQPGSLKYGDTGVYSMPLKENTVYVLNFAYRSHEDNSNNKVTVSVLNGEDGIKDVVCPGNASKTEWKTGSVVFTTGAAGNYVLTLANDGNTWMTNVSIFKAQSVDITVKEGFTATTYSNSDYALDFSNTEGLTACLITDIDGTEVEVNNVPASTGVYVKANPGTYKAYILAISTTNVENNKLVGTGSEPTSLTSNESTTYYVFGRQGTPKKEAFYKVKTDKATTVSANKAYLKIDVPASEAKDVIVAGGETNGINTVESTETLNETIYNLQGQKVNKAQRGIYIVNGKKVILK